MNTYSSNDSAAALGSFLGGAVLCYFLFLIAIIAFAIFIYYKIFQKTGNSGWLALLMIVPIVNLGMILFLAFSDWPVLRENRDLRARLGLPTNPYTGASGYSPAVGYTPPVAPTPYGQPPAAPYPPQSQPVAPTQTAPQPVAPTHPAPPMAATQPLAQPGPPVAPAPPAPPEAPQSPQPPSAFPPDQPSAQ